MWKCFAPYPYVGDLWKVVLIEEEFTKRMFETE